jgi:hypothetical protein
MRRHLDWLLSRIEPRADAIHALRSDGCCMDVSCFWVSASGHGGPSVLPAQMGPLARLGLELWFDVYLGDGQDAEPIYAITPRLPRKMRGSSVDEEAH